MNKNILIHRISVTLMMLVCVMMGMTAQNNKGTNPTKKYVVVNGENVRLRLEPSLQAAWLHDTKGNPVHAPKGAKLEYKGEKGDFYYVFYKNNSVYISKKFSYIDGQGGTNVQPAAPSAKTTKTVQPAEENTGDTYVVLKGTNVRLRLGPGTNYGVLNQPETNKPLYLAKGTKLIYLGEKRNGFYKASYKGKIVYVSSEFSNLSD